ncbi:hypothetical protein Tco_0031452 [Tanacetum coccineum]
MSTMPENVIVEGADNRPPMLEKSQYNTWQIRMLLSLYTRPRTYKDLTDKEKISEECDIRATNVVLQGLPPDVYILVNHYTAAKEILE